MTNQQKTQTPETLRDALRRRQAPGDEPPATVEEATTTTTTTPTAKDNAAQRLEQLERDNTLFKALDARKMSRQDLPEGFVWETSKELNLMLDNIELGRKVKDIETKSKDTTTTAPTEQETETEAEPETLIDLGGTAGGVVPGDYESLGKHARTLRSQGNYQLATQTALQAIHDRAAAEV